MSEQKKLQYFTQKISLVAGGVSVLYLVPSKDAQAAIIYNSTGLPTVSFSTPSGFANGVNWDVDGNGVNDFVLWNAGVFLNLANNSTLAGSAFVRKLPGNASNAQNLALNQVVGPTLAAGYAFGNRSLFRTVVGKDNSGNVGSSIHGLQGFTSGVDGYLGFKFSSNSNIYYGWATINVISTGASSSATIKNWAYNNTPDASINVGDTGQIVAVPEKTPTLALLALGAAGVYQWRKGKKKDK